MTDHAPGDWYLVIDLGQPLSEGSLEGDLAMGILRIPFATQQSVHVAAGKLKLYIQPPAVMVQGEVIEHTEDPARLRAIANAADYDVP